MLKLKNVSETYGIKVFTDTGEYMGDVEEVLVQNNKIFGWRIRATYNSFLSKTVTGAKGVIVPHQLVKAVGDIVIISKAAIPSEDINEEIEE